MIHWCHWVLSVQKLQVYSWIQSTSHCWWEVNPILRHGVQFRGDPLSWSLDHFSLNLTLIALIWKAARMMSHPGPCIKAPHQKMLLVISLAGWQVNSLCSVLHIFQRLTENVSFISKASFFSHRTYLKAKSGHLLISGSANIWQRCTLKVSSGMRFPPRRVNWRFLNSNLLIAVEWKGTKLSSGLI